MAEGQSAATLTVKIQDEGGGTGGAQGGAQTGAPSSAMGPGSSESAPTGQPNPQATGPGRWTNYNPGAPPPPIQNPGATGSTAGTGAPAVSGMALALNLASKAIAFFTEAVQLATTVSRADSESRATLLGGNNVIGAEIQKGRGTSAKLRSIPIVGGLLGAISDYKLQEKENYLREQGAIRQRAEYLGRYSGPLAQEIARGNMQQIRRDFAEAQTLGGPLSGLVRAQNEQEAVKQQIAEAKRAQEIPRQLKAAKDETARMRKELKAELAKLPKALADAIRKGINGPDPFSDMLSRMRIPEDHRQQADENLRRQRDGNTMAPLLGG